MNGNINCPECGKIHPEGTATYNKLTDRMNNEFSEFMRKGMKCPLCEAELAVFGTECYPKEGFSLECPRCDFERDITRREFRIARKDSHQVSTKGSE